MREAFELPAYFASQLRMLAGSSERTLEVKEHAKGLDAQAVRRGEVAMGGAQVLVLARGLVQHLDVGVDILVSPLAGILVEHLVGDFRLVELVVA